jgi:hypothetical protein
MLARVEWAEQKERERHAQLEREEQEADEMAIATAVSRRAAKADHERQEREDRRLREEEERQMAIALEDSLKLASAVTMPPSTAAASSSLPGNFLAASSSLPGNFLATSSSLPGNFLATSSSLPGPTELPRMPSGALVADSAEACVICCESKEDGNLAELVQPCSTCPMYAHMGCMASWRRQCRERGHPSTCPTCRTNF